VRGRTSNIKIELTLKAVMSCSVGCAVKKIPQGLAKRARAILPLCDGLSFTQTSLQVWESVTYVSGQDDLLNEALKDCMTVNDREESRVFPQVALYLVKIACERPDTIGRSLSDCTELARQLVAAGVVDSISASTIRRILQSHQLKPWQHHLWLSPKVPRDSAFAKSIH